MGIHYIFLNTTLGNPLSLFLFGLSLWEIFSTGEGSLLLFRILADGGWNWSVIAGWMIAGMMSWSVVVALVPNILV